MGRVIRLNAKGRWNVYELLLGYSRDEVDAYRRVQGAYRAARAAAEHGRASAPTGAASAALGTFGDQPVQARDAMRQASLDPAGSTWSGGRFASRADVVAARRAMRASRDARLAG